MPVEQQMPRYISHKVVWALKIGAIGPDEGLLVTIVPADTSFAPFGVPAGFAAKHKPESGGYYVVYEDGYASYSPAAAFEAGYTAAAGPRCIDPAHRYRLSGDQVLQFLKKVPAPPGFAFPGLMVEREGTTNEELIEVLLDRLRTINAQVPCRENSLAITKLEEAAHWLDARTRNRQARGVEGTPAS